MSDDVLMVLDDDEEEGEDGAAPAAPLAPCYIMLVVDDDPGIHQITRLALRDLRFENRPIELVSAYSAAEALEILKERNDIAVILLDVVMETEHAGLDLVHAIRKTLGNTDIRIVLRTGQPGQAPEEQVVLDLDINDYKSKTELSRERLFTTVIGALRGWRDLQELHGYRREAYGFVNRQAQIQEVMLDLIPDPAGLIDAGGTVLGVNTAFAALCGMTRNQLSGVELSGLASCRTLARRLLRDRGDGEAVAGASETDMTGKRGGYNVMERGDGDGDGDDDGGEEEGIMIGGTLRRVVVHDVTDTEQGAVTAMVFALPAVAVAVPTPARTSPPVTPASIPS